MSAEDHKPHRVPIEGTLDLHMFRSAEAAEVVEAFLEESQARGWCEVRIIHGKGMGTLRELVRAKLKKSPLVAGYRLADETSGGWGATWVTLKPKN